MSTAITPYTNASLDEKREYVKTLASAGELLPKQLWANDKNPETGLMENRPSPGKVMLIVETGLMLGLHPMAALRGIDVIEGQPTIKPSLMSALIRQAGHSLRIEPKGTVEGGDISCTTTIIRADDPDFPYVYTWTPADALRAGLIDSYAPDAEGVWKIRARSKDGKVLPWEAYTPRLLRWRSLSDAASAATEDVLMGMHYTAEELGVTVTEDGGRDIVDADLEPTEDWAQLVAEATTKDELLAIGKRATELGEYPDSLRIVVLQKIGTLSRTVAFEEAPAEEPEVEEPTSPAAEKDPAEPTAEEYEAIRAEADGEASNA